MCFLMTFFFYILYILDLIVKIKLIKVRIDLNCKYRDLNYESLKGYLKKKKKKANLVLFLSLSSCPAYEKLTKNYSLYIFVFIIKLSSCLSRASLFLILRKQLSLPCWYRVDSFTYIGVFGVYT